MAHEHAHRLIYAADLSFADCEDFRGVHRKAAYFLEETLEALRDTGVIIKGNTLFRVLGQVAFPVVAEAGLRIFADYKLFDVLGTLKNDFSWLRFIPNLEILTICERVPVKVFEEARQQLPNTIVAPIYPLTDLTDADFQRRGEIDRDVTVNRFFRRVLRLPANGIICSPVDLKLAPDGFEKDREIITPGIRENGPVDEGDTNAVNALTIKQAILAGSTRLVAGSMLRKGGNLRDNVERALDQIGEAIIERNGL